jgi:hypothetical protein
VLAGYLALVHTFVLLTGLAGSLTVGGLVIATLVSAAVALDLATRATPAADQAGPPGSAAGVFASLAALAAGLAWAWPHLVQATRLWVWDDYTYHMVYPAVWLREHAIAAPLPTQAFTMQAWYPLSASVVAAWFMTPWSGSRGDALAWVSLTGPLYAGLVVTAAAAVLARLECRPGAWAVPAVLLVTSPRIDVMASSFSDADLAQAAALCAAVAFAVPRGAAERAEELGPDAAYAGLLSGLALGVKISAAPLALLVLGLLLLRARAAPARRTVTRVALVVAAAWVLTGGYWYARNLVHTGNPVYPAAFLLWPGVGFPETTLLEYARHYGLRRAIADALVVYADWPRTHAVLALVGLFGLAGVLIVGGRALARPRRYFAGMALALAALVLLLLPLAPYSAGNAMTFRSGFVHWDSMRYVALVPLLGWIGLGFLLERAGPLVTVVVVATVLLAAGFSPPLLLAIALVVGASWALRLRVGILAPRHPAVALGIVAILALTALTVWRHHAKARATAESIVREPLFGAAAAVLDRQPDGTRVAVFGDQWIYPSFGARDHLRAVRLDGDGRLATAPIGGAMEPGPLTVDAATFRDNLRAAGVGLVVIVHQPHPGRSADWPPQHGALQRAADARLLHRDGGTAVWRVGGEQP